MAIRPMKLIRRPNWKHCLCFLLAFSASGIIFFGYFCLGSNCALRVNTDLYRNNYDAYFARRFLQNQFGPHELDKDYSVDIDNQDIVVFLHIQKTGGTTFGKHLVENLRVNPPCSCNLLSKKHCECFTKNRTVGNRVWLFSRYTTGWTCGLHADWTELKACVDKWFQHKYGQQKRRYLYITILRDPVQRFLSEWMHVQRGATWKSAKLRCNGRAATLEEVPFCHESDDWSGVTLKEFLSCRHNLAFNRQARMLANLSKVNCYNTTGFTLEERERRLLESAKENLLDMAYFGLMEYQPYTQFLFEHTLNMNFIRDFQQYNSTHVSRYNVSEEDMRIVARLNHLDIELYQFAKDLFLQRVRQAYIDDSLPVPEDLEREISMAIRNGGALVYTRKSWQNDAGVARGDSKGNLDGVREQSLKEDMALEFDWGAGVHEKDADAENADSIEKETRENVYVERRAFPSMSDKLIEGGSSFDKVPRVQADIYKNGAQSKSNKDLLGLNYGEELNPSIKGKTDKDLTEEFNKIPTGPKVGRGGGGGGMPRFDSDVKLGQRLKDYR